VPVHSIPPMCTREACGRPVVARGLCRKHYQADYYRKRHPYPRLCAFDQFMALTRRDDESGCLVWEGTRIGKYGRFRHVGAHRWIYAYCNGPIPAGLHIDHLCQNPPCVYLPHLQAVSQAMNSRRVTYRGDYPTPRELYEDQMVEKFRAEHAALLALCVIPRDLGDCT
jgi:hypothetical protein